MSSTKAKELFNEGPFSVSARDSRRNARSGLEEENA